jgi:hypothetical protein
MLLRGRFHHGLRHFGQTRGSSSAVPRGIHSWLHRSHLYPITVIGTRAISSRRMVALSGKIGAEKIFHNMVLRQDIRLLYPWLCMSCWRLTGCICGGGAPSQSDP